jgi:ABC-type antimicrobial peptide transport system permease subunit
VKYNNSSENSPRTSHIFNVLSALSAFMLWGGWEFYVNGSTGATKGLISGLTQGTASFIITLVMVHLVTWFFKYLPGNFLQLPLAAFFTVCITGSCLVGIHWLVHTPHIFYTIAPALSVAFAFCWYTAYKLRKSST